jgi:hypothetical protein
MHTWNLLEIGRGAFKSIPGNNLSAGYSHGPFAPSLALDGL